jgi:hypothetical protein
VEKIMLTTAQYEKQLSEKIATLELLLENQQNDVIISEIIKVIHLMATYGFQTLLVITCQIWIS